MKILEMGLAQSSISAMSADRHLVIGCRASDSDDLFEYIDCETPDVLVVDVDFHHWLFEEMPMLRSRNVKVPIVALASTNCVSRGLRRADFLENGGNDFLEKPIEYRELRASLDSLYRLSSSGVFGGKVTLKIGTAEICADVMGGHVIVDGSRLVLTPMEYKLLELMIVHKGQLITKKTITDTLYGFLDIPENNCIQVLMVRIRRKLEAVNPDTKNMIETVRRFGYRLNYDE